MKKILTGILMLSICVAFAQKSKEEKEKQAIYVKYKVKSLVCYEAKPTIDQSGKVIPGQYIKTLKTSFDKAGNAIEEISYNARGTIESWMKYEFDKYGNQTKLTIYNSDGTISNTIFIKNEYDKDNRVKESKLFKSDSTLVSHIVNYYNELGQLIKYTANNAYTTYEYDKMGRTIKNSNYGEEFGYQNGEEFKYNINGQLIEKTSDYVYTCKYDAKGLMIGTVAYDNRNRIVKFEKVTYEVNP